MKLDELVSQLKAAYGPTLKSVILYGSAVAGEHIEKKSDYKCSRDPGRGSARSARRRRRCSSRLGKRRQSSANDFHRGGVEILSRCISDGVRRHPRASSRSIRS